MYDSLKLLNNKQFKVESFYKYRLRNIPKLYAAHRIYRYLYALFIQTYNVFVHKSFYKTLSEHISLELLNIILSRDIKSILEI
jgi:hypothetical protein